MKITISGEEEQTQKNTLAQFLAQFLQSSGAEVSKQFNQEDVYGFFSKGLRNTIEIHVE